MDAKTFIDNRAKEMKLKRFVLLHAHASGEFAAQHAMVFANAVSRRKDKDFTYKEYLLLCQQMGVCEVTDKSFQIWIKSKYPY